MTSFRQLAASKFIWPILAVAAGACAGPARHFGTPVGQFPAAGPHSFAMAQQNPASAAVSAALVAAGFRNRDDGDYRVEVGFAVRARRLALLAPDKAGSAQVIAPAAKASLSLCRRQAYVLTIALVEHHTGTVVARSGAAISRCRGTPDTVLPLLARTALPLAS